MSIGEEKNRSDEEKKSSDDENESSDDETTGFKVNKPEFANAFVTYFVSCRNVNHFKEVGKKLTTILSLGPKKRNVNTFTKTETQVRKLISKNLGYIKWGIVSKKEVLRKFLQDQSVIDLLVRLFESQSCPPSEDLEKIETEVRRLAKECRVSVARMGDTTYPGSITKLETLYEALSDAQEVQEILLSSNDELENLKKIAVEHFLQLKEIPNTQVPDNPGSKEIHWESLKAELKRVFNPDLNKPIEKILDMWRNNYHEIMKRE